jgi:hypothetical protein
MTSAAKDEPAGLKNARRILLVGPHKLFRCLLGNFTPLDPEALYEVYVAAANKGEAIEKAVFFCESTYGDRQGSSFVLIEQPIAVCPITLEEDK